MIFQNVVIRARRPIHLLTRSSLRLHSTTKDDEASQGRFLNLCFNCMLAVTDGSQLCSLLLPSPPKSVP